MNRKLATLIVVLLLAGAVAIAIVKTQGDGGSAEGKIGGDAGSGGAATPTAGATAEAATGSKAGDRKADEVRDADLVEKYGSARTNLSRKISNDVVSVLNDAVEMGEMMSEFGGGRMRALGALRGTDIELTEEQREKIADLYAAHQKKEIESSRSAIEAVRKNPAALMELFLAGDALERGEMNEEDYGAVQASAGERLMGVINPLDRNNFRGGRPLEDEAFRSEFLAVLNEEQAEQWTAEQAERDAEREARRAEREAEQESPGQEDSGIPDGNISNIPTMELETLDEAVGSAKQVTSGLKQMMEGMGNLRNLGPMMEGRGEGPQE